MPKIIERLRPKRDELIIQLSTEDFSVEDIANIFNLSRQKVYDIINKNKEN